MPAQIPDHVQAFGRRLCRLEDPFVELDWSLSGLTEADLAALRPRLDLALSAMAQIDGGAVANKDEGRMVGHYWLRAPGLAPDDGLQQQILDVLARIEDFAAAVLGGEVAPPQGGRFSKLILCGIGGSALGPMLLGDVFADGDSGLGLCVLDNTDPDGIDRELSRLGSLADALVLVISKSGGTPETRNGMLEVRARFASQGLDFPRHAVAITMAGSALAQAAAEEGWLFSLPMWDWVGGRTSVTSAVGLLPLALLGRDVRAFLAGAAAMDEQNRRPEPLENPALLLAAMWRHEGGGVGARAMVALPYKDRLLLLARYLQQLVMESLGKRLDRRGNVVHQGLVVYGNKGSTDQHAYVQQLRDGRHDFFALFVRVLRERAGKPVEVDQGRTAGDYLDGFCCGTRKALAESGRHSLTLTVAQLDERTLGAMIALFERAVGLYAEMCDINAYDQPGVEAGKKAAMQALELQARLVAALSPSPQGFAALVEAVGADPADCWATLNRLAENGRIRRVGAPRPESASYCRLEEGAGLATQ
jgi:glucose-6-phosphate isomerase